MFRLPLVLAVLVALAGLSLAACDSGEDGPDPGLAVTGFAFTVSGGPSPDNVCGEPTRTSGLITGMPNPYRGASVFETSPDERILRFVNLPSQVHIEIVRAYWAEAGRPLDPRGTVGETVRIFEKDNPSRSLDWDLRDAGGDLVPSGFYRAFFTVSEETAEALEFGSTRVFDDLYVVQREVSELGDGSWADPTGCL